MSLESATGHGNDDSNFLSLDAVENMEPGNLRGRQTELRVASLLEVLPTVSTVTVTEKNGKDDAQMIDLIVNLRNEESVPPVDQVYVQVKSSPKGFEHLRESLVKKGVPYLQRKRWLLERRLIVLNGGITVNETGEQIRVEDEVIVDDFHAQLREIFELSQDSSHNE